MKTGFFITTLLVCAGGIAFGQAAKSGESQTFELTPAAPTGRYWLVTNPLDRLPGNGSVLYAEAAMTLNDEIKSRIDKALDAYSNDPAKFDELADAVEATKIYSRAQGTFDLMAVAARREDYQWDTSFRDQGAPTLLPYLGAERELGRLIAVRALKQIRAGKLDDAVGTIRLEYEMGRKLRGEQTIIGGLVSVAIMGQATDVTGELIKQPNSPNLYWALVGLPRPMIDMREQLGGEMIDAQATFPELKGDRIQETSAEEWRSIYNELANYAKQADDKSVLGSNASEKPDAIATEVTRDLPQAIDFYANYFNVPAEQVKNLDPFKVVATYWYLWPWPELWKRYEMTSLPYPVMMAKEKELRDVLNQKVNEQPANLFLAWRASTDVPVMAERYERLEREIAALADVEAIRAFATAHNGTMPVRLDEITETPALDNPRTGQPFDYQLHEDTATLSDNLPAEHPLKFTIRIGQ